MCNNGILSSDILTTIILKLENESPSYIKLVGCKNESG